MIAHLYIAAATVSANVWFAAGNSVAGYVFTAAAALMLAVAHLTKENARG